MFPIREYRGIEIWKEGAFVASNGNTKKKLLIYAHYYIPDVASTGQILRELAEGMLDTFDITVICVVPSYQGMIEKKYKTQNYYVEMINGVKVLRVSVPEFCKTKKISRIKNILSYFLKAMIATLKVGSQDYVFSVSQPPILGGLLGIWGKWIKYAKYIYNIQDFNPEQMMAVGYFNNKFVLKTMMCFDKLSCRNSDLVITVGRDLVETMDKRFTGKNVPKTIFINNWVDEKAVYPLEPSNEKVMAFKQKYGLAGKFVVMYSGNIGFYYGLENLIKIIEKFKPGTKTETGQEVVFAFVGSGSMLDYLIEYKKSRKMDQVVFIPYQDKEEVIYSLNAGDVHWCVNAKGIKGVSCPSKFYGIASCQKPVIGVLEKGSEIRSIIEECGCGLVCNPEDYDRIEENINWFIQNSGSEQFAAMGRKSRDYLIMNLSKGESIDKYKTAILSI